MAHWHYFLAFTFFYCSDTVSRVGLSYYYFKCVVALLGSSLGKLCTHSVNYDLIDINAEPFGCLPTTSLVIQVIFNNNNNFYTYNTFAFKILIVMMIIINIFKLLIMTS